MNKIRFDLKRPVEYSHSGESGIEGKFVVMFEPDYSNPDYFMQMQDIVSTSEMKLMTILKDMIPEVNGEDPGGEPVEKLHKKDLTSGLASVEDQIASSIKGAGKSSELTKAFRKMIKNSKKAIIMVDDKEKMEANILNQVWPIDLFNMAVRWVSFFVIAPDAPESPSSGMQSDSAGHPKEV